MRCATVWVTMAIMQPWQTCCPLNPGFARRVCASIVRWFGCMEASVSWRSRLLTKLRANSCRWPRTTAARLPSSLVYCCMGQHWRHFQNSTSFRTQATARKAELFHTYQPSHNICKYYDVIRIFPLSEYYTLFIFHLKQRVSVHFKVYFKSHKLKLNSVWINFIS